MSATAESPPGTVRVSEMVRAELFESIEEVAADHRELCARNPLKDYTRSRLITLDRLLAILVTWAEDTIGGELMDSFGWDGEAPSPSAFVQQWQKLSDEAMPLLMRTFLRRFEPVAFRGRYRLLAADGTGIRVPETGDEGTSVRSNQSAAHHDELHPTCAYDVLMHTFTDAVFQGAKRANEPLALCQLVDRTYPGRTAEGAVLCALWLADRNYCTFNVICHMLEAGARFCVRAKDEWAERFLGYVPEGEFDVTATRYVTRSRSRDGRSRPKDDHLYRVVDSRQPLDVLAPGSRGEYALGLRVVRVSIGRADDGDPDRGDRWLNLVTNLPRSEFDARELRDLYALRWTEETAYLHLKHVIGMRDPRTRDYARLCQEVVGRLILFDACALGISGVPEPGPAPRHERATDVTTAFKAMMVLLRGGDANVEAVASRYTHAVERGRKCRRRKRTDRPPRFKYRC